MPLDLQALFDKHGDEFLNFQLIENPRHPLRDVCAFLMLHDLAPMKRVAVSYASHDQIALAAEPTLVAASATEAQVIDLIRCGVRYSADQDCFEMFT